MKIQIRKYRASDALQTAKLFYDTVHSVNSADYSAQQINAWADNNIDIGKWNASLLEHNSFIAEYNGEIVGFGDIDSTGYLDRLYVHKDFQKMGVASSLCEILENIMPFEKITVHASITAKPFFESRGYNLVKKQSVMRKGIELTNFIMEKSR